MKKHVQHAKPGSDRPAPTDEYSEEVRKRLNDSIGRIAEVMKRWDHLAPAKRSIVWEVEDGLGEEEVP
jgi:hypothetical protein